jgi:hypothetical protein
VAVALIEQNKNTNEEPSQGEFFRGFDAVDHDEISAGRGGARNSAPAHALSRYRPANQERRIGMKAVVYLATALIGAMAIPGGHATAANVCRADPLVCPTTMPIDGFCQCKANGMTANGTVTDASAPARHYNSSAGGCGADPNDPGCHAMPTQGYAMPAQPQDMPPPPSMPPPPPPG